MTDSPDCVLGSIVQRKMYFLGAVRSTKRDYMATEDNFCPRVHNSPSYDAFTLDRLAGGQEKFVSQNVAGNECVLDENLQDLPKDLSDAMTFTLGQPHEISIKSERFLELEPEDFSNLERVSDEQGMIENEIHETFQDVNQFNNQTESDKEDINRRVDEAISKIRKLVQNSQNIQMNDASVGNSQLEYVDTGVGWSQSYDLRMISVAVGDSQPLELMDRANLTSQPVSEDSSTMTSQTTSVCDQIVSSSPVNLNIYSELNQYRGDHPKRSLSPTLNCIDKTPAKHRKLFGDGELSNNCRNVPIVSEGYLGIKDYSRSQSPEINENTGTGPVYLSTGTKTTIAKLRVGLSRKSRVAPLHLSCRPTANKYSSC